VNRGNREGGGDVAGALLEAARGNVLKRAENRKIPVSTTPSRSLPFAVHPISPLLSLCADVIDIELA